MTLKPSSLQFALFALLAPAALQLDSCSAKAAQGIPAVDAPRESLSSVLNGVEKRRQRLHMGAWHLVEESFSGATPERFESRRMLRMVCKSPDRRVDIRLEARDPKHNHLSIHGVSQGTYRHYIGRTTPTMSTEYSGAVSGPDDASWMRYPYCLPLEIAVFTTDLHLADMIKDSRWSVRLEHVEDSRVIFHFSWTDPSIVNDFSVTVLPSRDHAICQLIYRGGVAGHVPAVEWTYKVHEWQMTRAGMQVPRLASWTSTHNTVVPNFPGARITWNIHEVDDESEVDKEAVIVRFPTGTAVYDGIHNLSFIAGKAVVVADTDGTHYHTSLDAFPFLHDYTDPHTGMTDEQWNASPQKRMVEETWADVVDGKIVPRSAGARPVSAAAPAPLATERGYGPTVLLIGALMAASAAAVVLLRARGKSAA